MRGAGSRGRGLTAGEGPAAAVTLLPRPVPFPSSACAAAAAGGDNWGGDTNRGEKVGEEQRACGAALPADPSGRGVPVVRATQGGDN